VGAELGVASHEAFGHVLDRLRQELSPSSLDLFYRLIVDSEPVEEVCHATGLKVDPVDVRKSRLMNVLRTTLAASETTPVAS
jgi:hypothetical protein